MDKQYFAVSTPSHRSEPFKAVGDITGNEEMEAILLNSNILSA